MKKIIFVEGKAFIANEVVINPNAAQYGVGLEISAATTQMIAIAVEDRMMSCMTAFDKAVEENRVSKLWKQYPIIDGKPSATTSFGWVDNDHIHHHFSEAAYRAMESALTKLKEAMRLFSEDDSLPFTEVIDPEKFTLQELEQINKAVAVKPSTFINDSVKLALLEMVVVAAVKYGKNSGI